MYLQTVAKEKIQLEEVPAQLVSENGRLAVRSAKLDDRAGRVSRAASGFFALRASESLDAEPPVGVFREKASQLLRVVHKEIMIRWAPQLSAAKAQQILDKFKLEVVSRNLFVKRQIVVRVIDYKKAGAELVDLANQIMDLDEVEFATPNFISEYRREAAVAIPAEQWHLKNLAKAAGQKLDEDVNAAGAWAITQGKPSIVVAVLDDGVDVLHKNLSANILKKPDPNEPRDKFGRDFFIPDDDHPDHYDPRPKLFQFPYDQMTGNDIHGTPCAGVIAASGKVGQIRGIAPKCKVLAVKIFHADSLASDARVADAIRYAALHAHVLSCSWGAGYSPDIEKALEDAGAVRNGNGSAVLCAAGNGNGAPVSFPARSVHAVAVGATTDQGKLAAYSNVGPEIWVVAPSSGGVRGIFTTDVSFPNRGFNLGAAAAGGVDGLHTNSFGGTSSATPLAAGVAALILSVKPKLTRNEVKNILRDTAEKIGPDHDPITGHSKKFGYGRVDAEAAVTKAKSM